MTPSLDTVNPHDWSTIEPHFTNLLEAELTAGGVPAWLRRWSDLSKRLGEGYTATYRARSEDTTDRAAEAAYLHLVEDIQPRAEVASQALKTKLLAVEGFTPGADEVEFMRRLRDAADLFRDENVPIHSELAVLANEYDKTFGAMMVTLDGEELTLPQAESRLQHPDRAVREVAWRAVQERWLADREALDALYLKMLPLRRRLAANSGLSDFRAYIWREYGRYDYRPEDALRFHEAIEAEVVPVAARLFGERRLGLGLETLRPWDLQVDPDSRPALAPFSSVNELEEGSSRIFHRVDPELGRQFDSMRVRDLDLGSRKGKGPGGYCDFYPMSGRPYIFMNAVGTHDDVNTMLHEGGHAFHAVASSRGHDLIWNHWSPIEFAEVGSMAMELLASPYLEKEHGGFYSPEDAARARREHLEGIVQFLPYMAVVDAFQHWVYAEAAETVTAADLDAKWGELWTRFMPGADWSGLEAERVSGWHRKGHIFTSPFYYVEYGLAQVGALQVWRGALEDQVGALRRYREALALGNTRPLSGLFEAAGARLAFDRETVGELMELVAGRLERPSA